MARTLRYATTYGTYGWSFNGEKWEVRDNLSGFVLQVFNSKASARAYARIRHNQDVERSIAAYEQEEANAK